MRDLANKMAELKFEAPLAQLEEISDEWGTTEYQSTTINNMQDLKNALNNNNINNNNTNINNNNNTNNNNNNNNNDIDEKNENMLSKAIDAEILLKENLFNNNNIIMNGNGNNCELIKNQKGLIMINQQTNQTSTINNTQTMTINNNQTNGNILNNNNNNNNNNENNVDNFTEAFTGSLEDLVNTFDEKITKCFGNYEQSVEELAPVQVRSQEEIMNECQMWWTITGNFGNILPIDWSKSYARQMHMPTLKLGQRRRNRNNNGTDTTGTDDELNDLSSEDEAVAHDLDMHALILNGLHTDNEPIKTAEEVIKEIDDIMDETSPSDNVHMSEVMEKAKEVLGAPLYAEKLRTLTISELNELYVEMEILIREFSETLIAELALRDELEFEKELKNTFISLLLAVQNKRRQFHVDKKRGKSQSGFGAGGGGGCAGGTGGIGVVGGFGKTQTGADPKYLTTVIPYHMENGSPCNQALQVLIKILKAINDDSPTVPTLLTDYILKVLCPN